MSRTKVKKTKKLRIRQDLSKKRSQSAKVNEKTNRQIYEAGFRAGLSAREELEAKKEQTILKMREKIIAQMEKEHRKKMKQKFAKKNIGKAESKTKEISVKRRGRPRKTDVVKNTISKTNKRRGRPPKVQQPETASQEMEQVLE